MLDGDTTIQLPIIVEELTEQEFAQWDAYVASCPEATFFHRAGWKRVVERSFGQSTHFLVASSGGRIRGLLPLAHYKSRLFGNALISNGCCMGGGPIADDDRTHDALDVAACSLMDTLKADFLEYRRPSRRHFEWASRDDLYVTFERAIEPGEEQNLKQIPRKQRAVVRKAIDAGLVAEIDTTVDRFYPLYAETVHRLGTPVFAKSYFSNLLEEFGTDCEVLTVSSKGKPVSSVLSFYFRDRVMPYYAGAGEGAREVGANDFMYWRLMRHAVDRGYGIFDFGRSKIGSGPCAFKKNWGFEPTPVLHEYRVAGGGEVPEINPRNPKYRIFIAMWKKLPLSVANLLGPQIVRNIG
jgi:FemAB-related protein (PEP-CTERM system-associated)